MIRRILCAVLAASVAAGALSGPARAIEIAEARGDFYYDRAGNLVGMRNAEPPAEGRTPLSHREKLQRSGLQLPAARVSLKPRYIVPKPSAVTLDPGSLPNVIEVKFRDAEPVRLQGGHLSSSGSAAASAEAILGARPDARVERVFRTDERILDDNRETGELVGGRELPDLNNWYRVVLPEGTNGRSLANELLALDDVETVYFEPAPVEPPACGDIAPTTQNWEPSQFHLDPAPGGMDARYAWAYHAGGNGAGASFWVMDIEYSWCYLHEDYDADSSDVVNGVTIGSFETQDHGTAVLGLIGACDNGFGMTGIASDVTMKMVDVDNGGISSAVTTADSYLYPGEVMLLEQQVTGPSGELLPAEWVQSTFDAISVATANGIIVVEAAGNGAADLDSATYGGLFDPGVRHSGAVLVGASNLDHSVSSFSNYGVRVNVHAYGTGVYTTGYGALWSWGTTCDQDYTYAFNGTSSAAALVAGAATSLQGIANAKYGIDLFHDEMTIALRTGGTPQGAPTANHIGPMPDLVNAINDIEPDVLPYTPSGWSYSVVPRLVTGTTSTSCPLPSGALPGGGTTYFNWADQNSVFSLSPTVNSPDNGVFTEDSLRIVGLLGNASPGGWQYVRDTGITVKGGRHSIRMESDVYDVEQERIETNNVFARQFIWSGLPLSEDVPVSRTPDPVTTDSVWPGPYFNAEGFEATPTHGYWHAFAVAATTVGDDFDIRLNAVAPTNVPQAGFGADVAASYTGPDESSVVAWDLNTVAGGTYWASALTTLGTTNKIVEFDSDDGTLANGVNGPYTMVANDIVDVYELYLNGGTEYRVQVEVLSGGADFGISLLDGTSGYHDKINTVLAGGYADNAGAGQDEHVFVTPPAGDYYGLLVWKKGAADVPQSLTYNVHISTDPNLVGDGTVSTWDYPIVPRNDRNAVLLVDLPSTLNGWQPTTSFNWATLNEGANQAASPWETDLFVDDVLRLTSTASTTLNSGVFWTVKNSVQSEVRGGRHYLRSSADVLDQLTEFDETDNDFVDWFAWSPVDVSTATGSQPVPSLSVPSGIFSWYACDGYTATADTSAYWTAVAILPLDPNDDYDIELFDAYVDSKNAFGNPLAHSYDGPGATDFVIVNHNVLPRTAYDYGVLNIFDGIKGYNIRQSDAPYYASVPAGVSRYGPFAAGTPDPLELYEFYIDTPLVGVPVYISLNALSGSPNLGLAVFDGSVGPQAKTSAMAIVDSEPGGQDEHLGPVYFPAANYYCVAVYKQGAADRTLTGTYELVFSTGASAVDAPEAGALPADFALAPPSPNPFRGAATIRFDVPRPADVHVGVYDLAGRRVTTLAEGRQTAGRHAVTWDGRDDGGRRVGAGVYFVRLETATRSETRKVTLLR